jgi:hypothetical protein
LAEPTNSLSTIGDCSAAAGFSVQGKKDCDKHPGGFEWHAKEKGFALNSSALLATVSAVREPWAIPEPRLASLNVASNATRTRFSFGPTLNG